MDDDIISKTNKRFLSELRYLSNEEKKEVMRAFELTKHSPANMVAMAIVRDAIVYRMGLSSHILRLREEIKELRERVD